MLIEQIGGFSQDKKLEALIQAAYEFSPEFAEHLVTKYDSRFSDSVYNPVFLSNETQKLIHNPDRILKIYQDDREHEYLQLILGNCAKKLYTDLVSGHGRIPSENVLLEWIKFGSQYDKHTFFQIIKWVQECLNAQPGVYNLTNVFINLANLISEFATTVSPAKNEGIPEDIINILPGLSSKVVVFRQGEFDKTKDWLSNWLRINAHDYLKIVDPYFGPDQLIFFREIPKNCKVLIVTTDYYFKEFEEQERAQAQLEYTWKQYGKGDIPQMNFIIIPEKQTELFHDRVIISKEKGLDLGQSLNGLGNKIGKITDLPFEDAKELESKYVNAMLNFNTWFIDHNIQPMIIRVGTPQ